MDKTLKNGVKYDWNESPQPQTVEFFDLVGTDIAPVSKKTAVKVFLAKLKEPKEVFQQKGSRRKQLYDCLPLEIQTTQACMKAMHLSLTSLWCSILKRKKNP